MLVCMFTKAYSSLRHIHIHIHIHLHPPASGCVRIHHPSKSRSPPLKPNHPQATMRVRTALAQRIHTKPPQHITSRYEVHSPVPFKQQSPPTLPFPRSTPLPSTPLTNQTTCVNSAHNQSALQCTLTVNASECLVGGNVFNCTVMLGEPPTSTSPCPERTSSSSGQLVVDKGNYTSNLQTLVHWMRRAVRGFSWVPASARSGYDLALDQDGELDRKVELGGTCKLWICCMWIWS